VSLEHNNRHSTLTTLTCSNHPKLLTRPPGDLVPSLDCTVLGVQNATTQPSMKSVPNTTPAYSGPWSAAGCRLMVQLYSKASKQQTASACRRPSTNAGMLSIIFISESHFRDHMCGSRPPRTSVMMRLQNTGSIYCKCFRDKTGRQPRYITPF